MTDGWTEMRHGQFLGVLALGVGLLLLGGKVLGARSGELSEGLAWSDGDGNITVIVGRRGPLLCFVLLSGEERHTPCSGS